MTEDQKYLYIIDFWVLSSEYGGLLNVIASNEQECFEILANEESFCEDYAHLIMEKIVTATKLKLADDYKCDIIDAFIT